MPPDRETKPEETPLLDQLRALRKEKLDALGAFIEARQTARGEFDKRTKAFEDTKDPTDEQRAAFDTVRSGEDAAEAAYLAEFDRREAEIDSLDRRIKEQKALNRQRRAAARASANETRVDVRSEPLTYREDLSREGRQSYFADLAFVTGPSELSGRPEAHDARERLNKHRAEMEVELPKRALQRERRAQKQVDEAERSFRKSFAPGMNVRGGLDATPFERRVNPNRTDGQGGYVTVPTIAA